MRIRIGTSGDMDEMIPVVNAAFSVEAFLEGTRTDEERMRGMMQKGEFLVAEDGDGRILVSVYAESRGERGYFGMLAVEPSRQGTGLEKKMIEAAEEYCCARGCRCGRNYCRFTKSRDMPRRAARNSILRVRSKKDSSASAS